MFSNSLKMIEIERNLSELWQIACKKISTLVHLLALLCKFFIKVGTWITLKHTDITA